MMKALDAAACYPVLDILREMRKGIKGDSGDQITNRVKENLICSNTDRQLITWAVTKWLMEHCEK